MGLTIITVLTFFVTFVFVMAFMHMAFVVHELRKTVNDLKRELEEVKGKQL